MRTSILVEEMSEFVVVEYTQRRITDKGIGIQETLCQRDVEWKAQRD